MESELQTWSAKDPIARYRSWLQAGGLLEDAAAATIDREAESMAEQMRNRLRAAALPPAGEAIFGHVYERPAETFLEERQEFEASLESN
jgi:pyruvate dehydrogenase E1 component alpha subunit